MPQIYNMRAEFGSPALLEFPDQRAVHVARVLSLSRENEYFRPAILFAVLDDSEAAFLQAFHGHGNRFFGYTR